MLKNERKVIEFKESRINTINRTVKKRNKGMTKQRIERNKQK
jgi:hypothetical protein